MTFNVFDITIITNPFHSFFFELFWCQPCKLWKARRNNTSIFIVVSGRIPCAIIFISTFLSNLYAFSNESGFQRKTSSWMLYFNVPMKTSILYFSGISFTPIFNFWKSSMFFAIEPFCLRFINCIKKVFLFVSS